jgi:hypothetical protein
MRIPPVLIGLPIVVAFGVAEGRWTNRWSMSDELQQATARLAGVPLTIGAWEGHDEALDERQVVQAEMSGYLSRQYVDRRSGRSLWVLLVCGRPGPTSLHTPDVCLPANGYGETATPERVSPTGEAEPAEFWMARFQKAGDLPEPRQLLWSWSAGGPWMAPDHPRFAFGRYPFLYKLYVVQPLVGTDDATAAADRAEFLTSFLPTVNAALFAAP